VLKKAGIIVVAAAAGLVTLAPFAMADDADRSPSCDQSATNVQRFDTEAGDIDGDALVIGSIGRGAPAIDSDDEIGPLACSNVERLFNLEDVTLPVGPELPELPLELPVVEQLGETPLS
jgi:hypothetical protein